MKKYIDKILEKDFIYVSNLLYVTLVVLIIKKPKEDFQIYIDYCVFNA